MVDYKISTVLWSARKHIGSILRVEIVFYCGFSIGIDLEHYKWKNTKFECKQVAWLLIK